MLVVAIIAQIAASSPSLPATGGPPHQARDVLTRALPVLAFPERGLDDAAAYQGYQTRLFRDAAGNTVQIYLDARASRVVHLWADAVDESIGFTARGAQGRPAALEWDGAGARVGAKGRTRTVEHGLVANDARIDVGWFLLGSMRVERDLQYANQQKAAFSDAPYRLPEVERLVTALSALPEAERQRHLALLRVASVQALRARLRPSISSRETDQRRIIRVVQPALDGRDTLTMELETDRRRVDAVVTRDSVTLVARSGSAIPFTVRIITSGAALTPLRRTEIFNDRFLTFAASMRANAATPEAALSARRFERQVRGLELLASREKLMAGLPTYATYFGRDMLMTALMMRPAWRDEMSEFVIASVLRKLSPDGHVSHEEALGGQAIREAASEYASLLEARGRAEQAGAADSASRLLVRARDVLRDLRRVRENYHMIDAEYQFPIVVGRWLADSGVASSRKRAFLLDATDGGEPRVNRLLRELALVARNTAPYAADPIASNLVAFAARDSGRWASQSWRDSNVGYAGGRFAMDVNAIWAPHALESVGRILDALRQIGLSTDALAPDTPLGRYARDPQSLRKAVDTWYGAQHHFVVRLSPTEIRERATARIAAMPEDERRYWARALAASRDTSAVEFLALSLDAEGRPIPVMSSDPATRLFLGDREGLHSYPDSQARAAVIRDAGAFVRRYPIGLLVDSVGPVVVNDAYALPPVWRDFNRDRYHGPRVVWGRENNLFLIGALCRMRDAESAPATADTTGLAYAQFLGGAIDAVRNAVRKSGFHSELWGYEVQNGKPVAVRYGSGSDVQLWSTTDLIVEFLSGRPPR